MARRVRNSGLDSRSARAKLPPRHSAYWCVISPGLAVGYRKGARGGVWLVRLHDEQTGRRLQEKIGAADDTLDADNIAIFDFWQAQEKARAWLRAHVEAQATDEAHPKTVKDAATEYLEWFKANRKSYRDTKAAIDAHILPDLGDIEIEKLTTRRLNRWLNDLAFAPRRLRTRKGKEQRFGKPPETEEEIRRRRSTANRVLNILKALLNHAVSNGLKADASAWGNVKSFREADAARLRFLTAKDATRLVNACDKDFRPLVRAALHTGARYGELARLTVADHVNGKLHIRQSKANKSRWISLDSAGRAFFATLTTGKAGSDFIFTRADGEAWGKSHQDRRMADACQNGKIDPPVSFHELRHTYASLALMAGMPMMVLSQNLGHRDTRMVEKHYGHLLESYRDKMIEQFAPKFDFKDEETNVTPLKAS